eukprot:1140930-Pelagomonas_calceolata.AAC.1
MDNREARRSTIMMFTPLCSGIPPSPAVQQWGLAAPFGVSIYGLGFLNKATCLQMLHRKHACAPACSHGNTMAIQRAHQTHVFSLKLCTNVYGLPVTALIFCLALFKCYTALMSGRAGVCSMVPGGLCSQRCCTLWCRCHTFSSHPTVNGEQRCLPPSPPPPSKRSLQYRCKQFVDIS